MSKEWDASYALGEAGAYYSIGMGAVGVGVAFELGLLALNSSTLNIDWLKPVLFWTGLLAILGGAIIYIFGFQKFREYQRIRKGGKNMAKRSSSPIRALIFTMGAYLIGLIFFVFSGAVGQNEYTMAFATGILSGVTVLAMQKFSWIKF